MKRADHRDVMNVEKRNYYHYLLPTLLPTLLQDGPGNDD
jgi:hypothetical protein